MNLFLNPTAIIAILIAVSIHEWAHGWVAHRLGDPTAQMEGRLTLNPLSHLDLVGTLMFLFVGFGWAKPVPVDPRHFKHPKRDITLVALAGPVSNLILAVICFVGLLAVTPKGVSGSVDTLLSFGEGGPLWQVFLIQFFSFAVFINLALMAFNLLPIAPLDGSKILHMFIPYQYEREYELFMSRGPIILLILIIGGLYLGFPVLSMWVHGIVTPVLRVMSLVASMTLG